MKEPSTIVIAGVAGLVGQNLVDRLAKRGDWRLIGIDRNASRLKLLRGRHPDVELIHSDLAEGGAWERSFEGASAVVQLQAQVTGTTGEAFERNTIQTSQRVLSQMRRARVPYLVHVSSSAVGSAARDYYSTSKTRQEELVRASDIRHCVLRPTLLYGPFDPKHLGWLARFMAWTPVFPIPGHGRYPRQPIFVDDFCRVIEVCLLRRPAGTVYDLAGVDRVDYVDILRAIRRHRRLKTPLLEIPIPLFAFLLRTYAWARRQPPFTEDQLKALTIGDEFPGIDLFATFGVTPMPLEYGLRATFGASRS